MTRMDRRTAWCMALALSCLPAAGCGQDQADVDCIERTTASCHCIDGSSGVMVCESTGEFSECRCGALADSGAAGDGLLDVGAAGAAGTTAANAGTTGADAGTTGADAGTTGANGGAEAPAGAGTGGAASATGAAAGTGTAGAAGVAAGAGASGTEATAGNAGASPEPELEPFSFFVTSLEALQRLSGSPNGFGGDLRYGEADGISGADKICEEIAEDSMPGSAQKGWRAFLSATRGGPNGGPVNAIERIGQGPWYDRTGRPLAMETADLANTRPEGADPAIINDLPNEHGVPNHAPDGVPVDNHHMLTGSNEQGMLAGNDPRLTCQDWTSAIGSDGTPRIGMSWPRNMGGGGFGRPGREMNGAHWISDHNEAGCAPVDFAMIANSLGGAPRGADGVGSGGGYGGFYCFALTP